MNEEDLSKQFDDAINYLNTVSWKHKNKADYDKVMNYSKLKDFDNDMKNELYNFYENKFNEYHPSKIEKKPEKEDEYLNDFVQRHSNDNKSLTKKEFDKVSKNWSKEEDYSNYLNKYYSQPGKTISKVKNNEFKINKIAFKSDSKNKSLHKQFPELEIQPNSIINTQFPVKYNKDNFELHKVGPRNSWLIDLMFDGKQCYLVAININTRYLYVELMNKIVFNDLIAKDHSKSTDSFIRTFSKMLKDGLICENLSGDSEKCFCSKESQNFFKENGITWSNVDRIYFNKDLENGRKSLKDSEPLHSSLGIIDRVIRTLRDMAFNLGEKSLSPGIMKNLVFQYNHAPHTTLSKYATFSVSPFDVQNNNELETFIVRKIMQDNFNIMNKPGFQLNKGDKVKIYNDKIELNKHRVNVEPDVYMVVSFSKGLYKVENLRTKRTKNVPRFKICKI